MSSDPALHSAAMAMQADVIRRMRDHTAQFITPICRSLDESFGKVEGSGTFIELRGRPYLLTNEHVARAREEHSLAHFLDDGMDAARIIHPFWCITQPTDMALARIESSVLAGTKKSAVPAQRLASEFDPTAHEIMFIHGYPGADSYFSATFGGILARTFPYATDVCDLAGGSDTSLHFALDYPAGDADVISLSGTRTSLRKADGLSGTIVWDTRRVAVGEAWTPDDARVCGIVHSWDVPKQCLIATKVNVFRSFLIRALREDAALERWMSRGSPARRRTG